MYDMVKITQSIKRIVLGVINDEKLLDLFMGTVTSDSPLTIQIENSLELGEKQLLLSENVTDYEVDVELEDIDFGNIKIEGQSRNVETNKITTKMTVKNKLKTGDKVLMLRINKGQRFLVIDRLVI